MPFRGHQRTLALFGVVSIYIVMQFLWWAWLLWRQDAELRTLQAALNEPGGYRPHGLWMVVGEGSVVLILVLGGLLLTYRSIRRELALARTQRNFLLAASHELRTPIAGTKLHLQTLRREGLGPEEHKLLMERTMEDLLRLESLTERILMAARLDEPGVPLRTGIHDLVPLVGSTVRAARRSYANERPLQVIGPERLSARVDPEAFRSILDNLLENACKYSPQEIPVEVTLDAAGEMVTLEVADQGSGVAVDDRQRIFERFARGDSEETRSSKGLGLGLFIVRALVERMGGHVSVRDRAPHGSIFTASFPSK